MNNAFYDIVFDCPVIAAIKDDQGLAQSLTLDSSIIFILYGDILSIGTIVEEIKEAGKTAIVHMDLIDGLSGKEVSVDYINENTRADGIITTKAHLIKRAKELGLYTIMRFFIIDSLAYNNIERQALGVKPDLIEILPGVMPKVIEKVCQLTRIPVIAGGLVQDKEDVVAALKAGAISVSTTNQKVWFM